MSTASSASTSSHPSLSAEDEKLGEKEINAEEGGQSTLRERGRGRGRGGQGGRGRGAAGDRGGRGEGEAAAREREAAFD